MGLALQVGKVNENLYTMIWGVPEYPIYIKIYIFPLQFAIELRYLLLRSEILTTSVPTDLCTKGIGIIFKKLLLKCIYYLNLGEDPWPSSTAQIPLSD